MLPQVEKGESQFMPPQKALLELEGLTKHFPIRKGLLGKIVGHVHAVDDVSLTLNSGQTVGLVGESGCGKSTVGRCILKLYEPTKGMIRYKGRNIANLQKRNVVRFRSKIQMIFQDPYASLNPRMRVGEIIGEAIRVHHLTGKYSWKERVAQLLEDVGLQPEHMVRYPHEFSGGQRQRIGIARALAMMPELIVADEPVSALDVSIQAQILNLLDRLKDKFGLSYLVIAHDLAVVEHIADRIAVMYLGNVVELASDRDLYLNPKHPYTRALLNAIPRAEPGVRRKKRNFLQGDVPSPISPPAGCRFHTRCPEVKDRCRRQAPILRPVGNDHWVRCHLHA
jgi:oligopeptide transport system ATP-binding protein